MSDILPEGVEAMGATELDALIAALIERRAAMLPGLSAVPPSDPARMHRADNLLWTVRPAPNGRAAELALFHPGLGWTAITLSRAQIEDMENAFVFALGELPVRLNPAVG